MECKSCSRTKEVHIIWSVEGMCNSLLKGHHMEC